MRLLGLSLKTYFGLLIKPRSSYSTARACVIGSRRCRNAVYYSSVTTDPNWTVDRASQRLTTYSAVRVVCSVCVRRPRAISQSMALPSCYSAVYSSLTYAALSSFWINSTPASAPVLSGSLNFAILGGFGGLPNQRPGLPLKALSLAPTNPPVNLRKRASPLQASLGRLLLKIY